MAEDNCYIVNYDYKADQPDELTLHVGELILDASVSEEGWMEGIQQSTSRRGLFPDNFVTACETATVGKLDAKMRAAGVYVGQIVFIVQLQEPNCTIFHKSTGLLSVPSANLKISTSTNNTTNSSDASVNNNTSKREAGPQKRKHVIGGIGFGNIFSGEKIVLKRSVEKQHNQQQPQQLPPPPPPPPASEKPRSSMAAAGGAGAAAAAAAASTPAPAASSDTSDYVVVLHAYTANNKDELSIEPSQIVRVISREVEDEGWWKGELNGKIGVFPDNFVEACPPPQVNKNRAPPPVPAKASAAAAAAAAAAPQPAAKPTPPRPAEPPAQSTVQPQQQQQQHQPLSNITRDRPKQPNKRPPVKTPSTINDAEQQPIPNGTKQQQQQQQLSTAPAASLEEKSLRELQLDVKLLLKREQDMERELQELQKFKKIALAEITALKDELDDVSKKYHSVTVDMERMRREIFNLSKEKL